jgi:hypothetical protein
VFCLFDKDNYLTKTMSETNSNHILRDGVHVSRFSPYIASLEPTMPFLNDEKIMPRCCTEIDVGALLNNIDFIQQVAQDYDCNTMAVNMIMNMSIHINVFLFLSEPYMYMPRIQFSYS